MTPSAVAPRIPYQVRVSRRARRVRLTVTAREGLVIVVPAGWRGDPEAIVAEKAEWAEQALARVADARALHAGGPDALLPDEVAMPALGRSWVVEYRASDSSSVRVVERPAELVVSGDVDDGAACLAALNAWLHRVAREHLSARLAELAQAHGLSYSAVRIARQRSRWGSCSARGTISLNRNLLFLAPELVDALILHELAHTRVMNHSPRFWAELERLDPNAREHRARMRDAARLVPAWADA